MKWYRHVLRREYEYVGKRVMMVMEMTVKRRRGRPKRRWLDNIKNDLCRERENCQGRKLKTEFNGGVS